jgi:hypothetical protein
MLGKLQKPKPCPGTPWRKMRGSGAQREVRALAGLLEDSDWKRKQR